MLESTYKQRSEQMAYQIEVSRQGNKKIIRDAITMRPRSYATLADAQASADSHFALWRADWKTQGRRNPVYRFVEVVA